MRVDASLWKRAAAMLGASLTMGCSSPDMKTIQVHWQLVDGRSCADAGAVRVVIQLEDGSEFTGRCSLLPDGNRIDIPSVTANSKITARAESAGLAVLYRSSLTLPSMLPDVVEVVLSYSGGR